MKKSRLFVYSCIIACSLLTVRNAHAVKPEPPDPTPFIHMYTTDADGSTTLKDVFGFDETPYLYLKLPANIDGSAPDTTFSDWTNPSATNTYNAPGNGGLNANNERWISLSNWFGRREVGVWNITAEYEYKPFGTNGTGTTTFTVTPEPLAMALFAIGGAPIALSLHRRRKKNLLKI